MKPPPVPPESAGTEAFQRERRVAQLERESAWLLQEVKRVGDIVDAAKAHYDAVVLSAVKPYLDKLQKLDSIEAELVSAKHERERRAANDEAEKRIREREAHAVDVAKKMAETAKLGVDAEYVPIDSRRRVRMVFITAVFSLFAALVSAMVVSWMRR